MTPTGQLELSDLTVYAIEAAWLDAHPKAETHLVGRARYINQARHQKARIHALMEELLGDPDRYGIDRRANGSPYLLDKNLWAGIARVVMERHGVEFTTRRTKHEPVTA